MESYGYGFDPASCDLCDGFCCRGERGYIFVSEEEIGAIANFLGKEGRSLMRSDFQRLQDGRYSLSELRLEEGDYGCIFFDPQHKCTIYPVRPTQCRTFPFWELFQSKPHKALEACPFVSI